MEGTQLGPRDRCQRRVTHLVGPGVATSFSLGGFAFLSPLDFLFEQPFTIGPPPVALTIVLHSVISVCTSVSDPPGGVLVVLSLPFSLPEFPSQRHTVACCLPTRVLIVSHNLTPPEAGVYLDVKRCINIPCILTIQSQIPSHPTSGRKSTSVIHHLYGQRITTST
jgi:hypothetical protein